MPIPLGATAFFNNPRDFQLVLQVIQQYPFLSYLEFRGEHPFFFPEVTPKEHFQFYRNVLKKTRLRTTVHATMYDINLATLNPWLKEANIRCYKRFIDVASYFESEILVIHDGILPREFVEGPDRDVFIARAENHLVETLYELAEYGQQKGVKIALENAPPKTDYSLVWDADSQIKILKTLNHPYAGALLDLAHAALHQLDLETYLKKISPWLLEIHAHNNNGKLDEHLGLHEGVMDYVAILTKFSLPPVPLIMEIKSYSMLIDTLNWLQAQGIYS